VYYSHGLPVLLALPLAAFVLFRGVKKIPNVLFFALVLLFSLWSLFDLILWASADPSVIMFSWSMLILLEPLIYVTAFYFVYKLLRPEPTPLFLHTLLLGATAAFAVLLPTSHAIQSFNLTNCDREVTEGVLVFYGYWFQILVVIGIIGTGLYELFFKNRHSKLLVILVVLGTLSFLLLFSLGNIVGSFSEDWAIGQYGLFGMPFFVGFLAYIMNRFQVFKTNIHLVELLITLAASLILALLFLDEIQPVRIIALITFVLFGFLGSLVVRGVRREHEQRLQIEKLAHELEAANERQVGLIHFITHQIKGFVTKSRNIFASMKEGDCGTLPDGAKPLVEEGFSSDTKGLMMIQDILNAANIKSGKVAFDMKPFDLKALIEEIVASLKPAADAKGLALNLSLGDSLTVTGDRAQLSNVYKNVIDNAIKYTPKGSVSVSLEKKDGKAVFKEEDTGVGISAEDMRRLFTEGGHGVQSAKVNTESTGFGLYIAKSIVDAHKGRIWAESEGEGKGSRFIIELPL
jgi:signal transduction histidine kinase